MKNDMKGESGIAKRFRSKSENADSGSTEPSPRPDDSPKTKRKPGAWDRFKELRWRIPNGFPHGIFGIAMFITGGISVLGALIGKPTPRWIYLPFVFFTFCNASSGFMLTMGGWRGFQFRIFAVMLMATGWMVLRFDDNFGYSAPVRVLDIFAALSLIGCACAVGVMMYKMRLPVGHKAVFFIGIFGLLTLCIYPVQFAIGGEEWVECVLDEWPKQRILWVHYAFIQITWLVATQQFGTTLREKGAISPLLYFVLFGFGTVAIVASSTITLDTWYPVVTTARVYIPCPAAPEGTWRRWISDTLNASYVTKNVFGVAVPDEHFR